MSVSEANKKAAMKYMAANVKQIKFNLSIKYDADIIAHLDAQKNKQGYLKALIREDIARAKVSTAPAQNILKEDTTMEYKANTLSQSLPIDAQKDALPIRENSPRAKSKKEDNTMIKIIFVAGTSRNGDYGVNYMMPYPGANSPDLYAEIPVPDGADEEYGYFDLKGEIIRQAIAQNIDPASLSFWYDGQEQHLSPAARAKSENLKEDKTMNTRIAICTINHNTEPDTRMTISYDPAQKAIYTDTPGEEDMPIAENLETLEAAEDTCNAMYNVPFWDLEWIEHDDLPTQNPDDPGVPSGGNPWYAVLATSEDDWSKGSFDLGEAKAMAREIRKKHPGAMIAVIDNSLDYPFCSDTITDF